MEIRAGRRVRLMALALAAAVAAGCGGGGGGGLPGDPLPPIAPADPDPLPQVLQWGTFPEARVVLGQPDFDRGDQPAGTPALDQLRTPEGNPGVSSDGTLFVAGIGGLRAFRDYGATSGASARFGIEADASGVSVHGNRLVYVGDNQVRIFNRVPEGAEAQPDVTFGAGDLGLCEANRLNRPRAAYVTPKGKLVVADTNNNRVLIWNRIPEGGRAGNADIVIGQGRKTTCQPNDGNEDGLPDFSPNDQTLNAPISVWSDDVRLVVVDQGNHRVLIWDEFPTTEFQPANRVIGQNDFTLGLPNGGQPAPSDTTLLNPASVDVRPGGQMVVADAGNHRVLVWNAFPESNGQAASQVIGQRDFSGNAANAGGATGAATLRSPMGVRLDGRNLIVVDRDNHRALVFRATN